MSYAAKNPANLDENIFEEFGLEQYHSFSITVIPPADGAEPEPEPEREVAQVYDLTSLRAQQTLEEATEGHGVAEGLPAVAIAFPAYDIFGDPTLEVGFIAAKDLAKFTEVLQDIAKKAEEQGLTK